MRLRSKRKLSQRSSYFSSYLALYLGGALFWPLSSYGAEPAEKLSTYTPEQYINETSSGEGGTFFSPVFFYLSEPPKVFFTATSNDPLPAAKNTFTSDNKTTITIDGVQVATVFTPGEKGLFRPGATVTLTANVTDMNLLDLAFRDGKRGGFWIGGPTDNLNYYEGPGGTSVKLKSKNGGEAHIKHVWDSEDKSKTIVQDANMSIETVNAIFTKKNWYLNWNAASIHGFANFKKKFTHEGCSSVGCEHYGVLGEAFYSVESGAGDVSALSEREIVFNKSALLATSPIVVKITSKHSPVWNDTINIFPQYLELYQGTLDPNNLPTDVYVPFSDGDLNDNGLIDSSEASLSMSLFSDLYKVKVRKRLHKSERNILFSFMPKILRMKILDGSQLLSSSVNEAIAMKFPSLSSEFAVILSRDFSMSEFSALYDLNQKYSYKKNSTTLEIVIDDEAKESNIFAIGKPDYYENAIIEDKVFMHGYGVDLDYPNLWDPSSDVDIERYIGGEIRMANPGRPAVQGTLSATALGKLNDYMATHPDKNYSLSLTLSGNGELIPPPSAENFDFGNIPNPAGGGSFSFKATADSGSKRSIEAVLSLKENSSTIHQDKLKLTALRFDVDIDSNGDGVIRCEYPTAAESAAIANGTATEEVMDKIADEMGKMNAFVPVNAGDKDGDGIVDIRDYQISSDSFNENVFKAIQITLPQSIQRSNYRIYLNQPSTSFQLWKKPSNALRTAADRMNSGYYNVTDLPATLYLEAKQAESSPAKIDFTLSPIKNKVPSWSSTLENLDLAAYPANLNLNESIAVWSDTITLQSVSCGSVVSTVTNAADITDTQTIYVPAAENGYVILAANFNCSVGGMNYLPTWTASESNVLSVPSANELPDSQSNSSKYIKVDTSSPKVITVSASYNGCIKTIKIIAIDIQPISINATTPANTIITYQILPQNVQLECIFYAGRGGEQSKLCSNECSFEFNQEILYDGDKLIFRAIKNGIAVKNIENKISVRTIFVKTSGYFVTWLTDVGTRIYSYHSDSKALKYSYDIFTAGKTLRLYDSGYKNVTNYARTDLDNDKNNGVNCLINHMYSFEDDWQPTFMAQTSEVFLKPNWVAIVRKVDMWRLPENVLSNFRFQFIYTGPAGTTFGMPSNVSLNLYEQE